MLLTALKEYADTLPRTPAMYAEQPIRYLVELRGDGTPLGTVTDLATSTKGREARGTLHLAPSLVRASSIKPKLLMDNAEYVLGLGREGGAAGKVAQRHQAFLDLTRRCAETTAEPAVQAVLRFLEGPHKAALPLPDAFDPSASVTFRVDLDVYPIDLPAVQGFWARANGADDGGDGATSEGKVETSRPFPCLLCGRLRPALRRMPYKVKNIPGGQTSGTSLISANASAFESYGLEQSLIAPLCQECAEGLHKGLNALIEGASTHLRRDPLQYVFWTRGAELPVLSFLNDPRPEEVKELLRTPDTARVGSVGAPDAGRFYAASLAGSGGRVAVRDWLDITVPEAQANLARFFRLQAIVDLYHAPELLPPLPVWQLSGATVRDPRRDDPPPSVLRSLYRTALSGDPLPMDVLFAVVRRLRAEQSVTPARAALIKLVLLSQPTSAWKEDQMAGLDKDERRPAYLCGRLLAVLESIQRQAIGDVNATIVDRFYGSASSTPIAVFPRLVRGAQPHLARLRRDKYGAYVNRQNELQEILAGLPEGKGGPAYPTMLTLEQQGLFSLGYYHQRAFRTPLRAGEPLSGDSAPASSDPILDNSMPTQEGLLSWPQ